LNQAAESFGIFPDVDLGVMVDGQSLSDTHAKIMQRLTPELNSFGPDLVIVHGDTTTTLAGALASFYLGYPVAHIEAGLRTHNMSMPFPEEINRTLVSKLATWHFAPTELNKKNLVSEGISSATIFVTGNTVIDAMNLRLQSIKAIPNREAELFSRIKSKLNFALDERDYVIVTVHRRENFAHTVGEMCHALLALSEEFPDLEFVVPLHPNPAVGKIVRELLGDCEQVHVVEPFAYDEFLMLLENCLFVVTDSGGLQEEAPNLNKPVLLLRESTERPEGITSGGVKLVALERAAIVKAVSHLLNDEDKYRKMSSASNPYGDGTASEAITRTLMKVCEPKIG